MNQLQIEIAREKYIATIDLLDTKRKELNELEAKAFREYLHAVNAKASNDARVLECISSCFIGLMKDKAFGGRDCFTEPL